MASIASIASTASIDISKWLVNKCIKTEFDKQQLTVGSKIIRALVIIRVKKLIPNGILGNKYFSNHDLQAYAVYNKHEMIKTDNQTTEKSQVLE